MKCIDINNDMEYQALVKESGLPPYVVEAYCGAFLEDQEHGGYSRYPHLDELPYANSEPYLKLFIHIREDGTAKVQHILEATNTSSIEEAQLKLNNQFTDQITQIILTGEDAEVFIEKRPASTDLKEIVPKEYDDNVNDAVFFNLIFDRLQSLYGIEIIPVTTLELQQDEFKLAGLDAETSKAFIYNGKIYVNTDIASIDSPIHELLHILLGGLRFSNPNLYLELIGSVLNFKPETLDRLSRQYKNRTRNDLYEEIFVNQLANYLVGKESDIPELGERVSYELFYNINRMLDSMLIGEISASTLQGTEVFKMSLSDIAKRLNSDAINNNFKGSLDDAYVHRILGNYKESLLQKNRLEEVCE